MSAVSWVGRLFLVPWSGVALAAAAAAPAAVHVSVLAAGERTSVVIELAQAPSALQPVQGAANQCVLELGPIDGSIAPRTLSVPAPITRVTGISLREVRYANGPARMRVSVNLQSGSTYSVRAAGPRIYIDVDAKRPSQPIAALPPPSAAQSAPVVSGKTREPSTGEVPALPDAPRERPARQVPALPDATRDRSARPAPSPREAQELAALSAAGYDELEPAVTRLAAALAERPDVNGLVALRAQVVKRDQQLGQGQPELIQRLLAGIDRRLMEARSLQLKLDAQKFRPGRGTDMGSR